MRRLFPIVAVTVLGLVGLAIYSAPRVGAMLNRVEGPPLPTVSEAARRLHASVLVADLHGDALLWGRDLAARSSEGHIDLPRLREGGVGLQGFGLVTQVPVTINIHRNPPWPDLITALAFVQGWPEPTLSSRRERALYQARILEGLATRDGRLILVRRRADLDRLVSERARDASVLGALLGIEGAQALDGDPANLAVLFGAGLRMAGLAHFFDNDFAGSAHGVRKEGLTERGRAVVGEAERLGIAIDLAHSSEATIRDVLAMTRRPPVVSHTGVQGTCANPRNLSDAAVRAIAAAGGVIGIGFWETAVCGSTPADVARAIRHVADVVGDDHVALGSDFDGAVTTPFDASGMPVVTQALLDAGLANGSIRKVLGENVLRVLRETLPP